MKLGLIEAYTTLGFIAAHTHRVRLLALATAVSYRHAGLLAKMVTTRVAAPPLREGRPRL
jgi:alkanesulfonate monooxygenase SsuD/methylene tetrahydromethanopterin reductase-like flavin-dependent oxidoreductase (luciferase family)